MSSPTRIGFGLVFMLLCVVTNSNAQLGEATATDLVSSFGSELCASLAPLPEDSCMQIVGASAASMIAGSTVDLDALRESVRTELTSPSFLNSAVSKVFGGNVPLGLEFKMLDGDDDKPVVALSYAIDYQIVDTDIARFGGWNRRHSLAFKANGTLTQESLRNPRNFLDTKLTAAGSLSTAIPQQSPEFNARLTEYAVTSIMCDGDTESAECIAAAEQGYALLDSTTDFLQAFQRYEYGLDAGVESDEEFEARHYKVGGFLSGQYERWGSSSILDAFNVSPAFRIGIDRIDPDGDDPRTLAGDESMFWRFSGEVSLWVPLGATVPLALTFNHRYYRELSASSVVKDANLHSYNLTTFSLTGSNGLFASYSTGRLPLAFQNDNVVELGWKTYF